MLFSHKLSETAIYELSHQLALLLNSNISLSKSLELLYEHRAEALWKKLIHNLQQYLNEGYTLSSALNNFPEYFPNYYCSLIQCGENSSTLPTVLEQLAHYQKLKLNSKKKIMKALAYPGFVLSFSLCISLAIILWVIPQFADLFQQAAGQLPWITRALINFSKNLSNFSLLIVLGIINLIYAANLSYRYCFLLRWHLAKFLLKMPLVTHFIQLSEFSRWLRLISTQLKAGIKLFPALQASEIAYSNLYHKAAYQQLLLQLHSGTSLNEALKMSTIFPNSLINLLSLSEYSGKVDTLFSDSATLYEGRLESFLLNITQWIEPLSLLLIAALSGMLIVALYLPIFRIGELL